MVSHIQITSQLYYCNVLYVELSLNTFQSRQMLTLYLFFLKHTVSYQFPLLSQLSFVCLVLNSDMQSHHFYFLNKNFTIFHVNDMLPISSLAPISPFLVASVQSIDKAIWQRNFNSVKQCI